MNTSTLKLGFGLLLLALAGCGTQTASIEREGALLTRLSSGPVVNSLGDSGDGICDATECTLREAITAADPGATITFDVTGTITLTGVELVIGKDLVITGPGASNLSVSGGYSESYESPGRYGRVFRIDAGATVSISGLTITGGSGHFALGGGIWSAGTLSLTECAVSGNRAMYGGGIYNASGTLTLTNTTVSENDQTGEDPSGGGIYNTGGTVTLTGSTVSGNSSDRGAGIASWEGTLVITRSTISGNLGYRTGGILVVATTATITDSTISDNWGVAGGGVANWYSSLTLERSTISGNSGVLGGGIFSRTDPDKATQHTTILNSTVSGNSSDSTEFPEGDYFGGGIYNEIGLTRIVLSTVTGNQAGTSGGGVYSAAGLYDTLVATTELKGSVVWGNTSGTGAADDVGAFNTTENRYLSLGHNLVGAAGVLAGVFGQTGDQSGVAGALLGPLASNGGPTDTHALLAGSPAIDTGTCADHAGATVATDQRGVSRPQGPGCDIGAYEYEYEWVFTGFFSPVNNEPALNTAKAGQTIPLKWHLEDVFGHPITSLESVTVSVTSLACAAGTTTDAIEEYATGTSGLQNLGDGYYQFNWATPKGYAGSCKTMRLDLGDGITHNALFQFTK